MRRYIIIASIILLSLGVGVAAYYLLLPKTPAGSQEENSPLPIAGDRPQSSGEFPSSSQAQGTQLSASNRLVKISSGEPVASGVSVLDIKKTTASSSPDVMVNFVEKQSGNIYTYRTGDGSLTRTSNRTIPGIMSAIWFPDGKTALARYLSGTDFSTINTYALRADGSEGFFLSQDLAGVAVSSTSVLMLASGTNGSTASLARADGSRSTVLFTTPLSALRISFAGKNQYLAFTKPASSLAGSAYIVDNSGNFSRIAGPENGLTALASPTGKWVLVSSVSNGSLNTKLINTTTNESIALPIATLTEKCVWTSDETIVYCGVPKNPPVGNYPDDWYQGVTTFSDRIWKIQVAGRYTQLVLDFAKEAKGILDVESMSINPSGTVLVFTNKNDGALWAYQL